MKPPSFAAAAALLSATLSLVLPAEAIALAESGERDDLRLMREQILALQDRVEAQERRIEDQQDRLREAGLDERGSASGLSTFLLQTDFRGWVATSYFWNFNNPRGQRSGANGPFSNPFHADHNSFQLDEAWLVMDRAATRESPAGFHIELAFGATSSTIQGSGANGNANDLWVPAAHVSYRTPWGPTLTAGKFVTPIGYEKAGAPNSVHVTRGFAFTLFQPLSQTGVLASQRFDNGLDYTLGVVNGFRNEQPNFDDEVGALAQVGWANDRVSVHATGFYTEAIDGRNGAFWLADVVAELTPSDRLLFWLNLDYRNEEQANQNPWAVAAAAGARFGVTDDLGIGGRVEYAHFDDEDTATFTDANGAVRPLDGDLWSFTGTLDYALTEELVARLEAKYEKGQNGLGASYRDGRSGTAGDLILLGSQLYYQF